MDCIPLFIKAKKASRSLIVAERDTINTILMSVADAAVEQADYILSENKKDLSQLDESDPRYDRLKLTSERLHNIASDIRNVVNMPFPFGNILMNSTR